MVPVPVLGSVVLVLVPVLDGMVWVRDTAREIILPGGGVDAYIGGDEEERRDSQLIYYGKDIEWGVRRLDEHREVEYTQWKRDIRRGI